jgi:lipopolysaccharide transport system permease protein
MLYQQLELVWYKAYADLRAEAARAYLGVLWWVLEPLLYICVFYLVFGVLLERGGQGFVSFMLCGLVVWRWFSSSLARGANAIPSSAGLMMQVYLPKYLFPAIVLITHALKFIIVFALFLTYLLLAESSLSVTWLALPVVLIVQILLIVGCTALLAAVVPFLPDVRMLIENALTLLFFLSGIFYDIGEFPDRVQSYFLLNPMAVLIDSYRSVLLEGVWPHWTALGIVVAFALTVLAAGLHLLVRYDRVYPRAVAL